MVDVAFDDINRYCKSKRRNRRSLRKWDKQENEKFKDKTKEQDKYEENREDDIEKKDIIDES